MPGQKPPILFHSEFVSRGQVTVTIHNDDRLLRKNNKIMVDMLVDDGRQREEMSYQCENQECERFFKGTKGKTLVVTAEGSRDSAMFQLVREVSARAGQSEPARQSEQTAAPTGLRCTEVRYEYTLGLPNYCSEKIGLTVAVEPGAKAADALEYAKRFVEARLTKVGR